MAEVVQLLLGAGGLGVLGLVIGMLLTHIRGDRKPAAQAIADARADARAAWAEAEEQRRLRYVAEDRVRDLERALAAAENRPAAIEPPPVTNPTGGPV